MFEQAFKSIDDVLSVKNPNGGEAVKPRRPKEIMAETAALDAESTEGLAGIRRLL